jgi:hypothetical protein
MADPDTTTLLENEKADRFAAARSTGVVMWTREQGDQIREIIYEQSTTKEEDAAVVAQEAAIEDKFNS